MATLISKATGNFTDATTWAPIDTASELHTGTTVASLTTTVKSSATFVPAANTLDGVAIKVQTCNASVGTNDTVTVLLKNVTSAGTREATGTFKAKAAIHSSLLGVTANPGQWYFVKFASTVTPNGTDTYRLDINASTSLTLSLYTNATTNNWNRMLRRSGTDVAPALNDALHIMGEIVPGSPDTYTSYTVTMDNTATTSFAPVVSGGPPFGFSVGNYSTLACGTSASTNYYLKWKGYLSVAGGGTVTVGTAGTPMPSTSTAVLEMASVGTSADSGVWLAPGSTLEMNGTTKTTVATVLTADKAINDTVLTVASTSGWSASDEIAMPATTITAAQNEKRTISTVDSATQVTISAGLTYAHSGTSPTQAEVINLTRNVKVRGLGTTTPGFIYADSTAVFKADYVQFTYMGSATTSRYGLTVNTTTPAAGGIFSLKHSSYHDAGAGYGVYINSTSYGSNLTITDNVFYLIPSGSCIYMAAASSSIGTGWTITGNYMIAVGTSGNTTYTVELRDLGGTFSNNTIASGRYGAIWLYDDTPGATAAFDGNTIHSCLGVGITIGNLNAYGSTTFTFSNLKVWRNTNYGMARDQLYSSFIPNITISDSSFVANGNAGLYLSNSATELNWLLNSCTFSGDTVTAQPRGIQIVRGTSFPGITDMILESCTFGVAAGTAVAHSTADIALDFDPTRCELVLRNCKLSSSTDISLTSRLHATSFIKSGRHQQTAGNHKSWYRHGTVTSDTTEYRTAAPSERLTPLSATVKLASGGKKAAVANSGTLTPTVYVKKSAAYNGAQPRLIVRKNVAAGINSDTVLATASGSTGSYLTLTGTTASVTDDVVLEFYVDCDGTAGFVNVDDWSVVSG